MTSDPDEIKPNWATLAGSIVEIMREFGIDSRVIAIEADPQTITVTSRPDDKDDPAITVTRTYPINMQRPGK